MQIVSAAKKKLDKHVKNENIRDSAEKKHPKETLNPLLLDLDGFE